MKFTSVFLLVLGVSLAQVLGDKEPIRQSSAYIPSASAQSVQFDSTAPKIVNSGVYSASATIQKNSILGSTGSSPRFVSGYGSSAEAPPSYQPTYGPPGQPTGKPIDSYGPPQQQPGKPIENTEQYTYYYQHYPQSPNHQNGWSDQHHHNHQGGSWGDHQGQGSGDKGSIFDFGGIGSWGDNFDFPSFDGFGKPGGGGGGGASTGLKIAPILAIVKKFLILKPLLIIGLIVLLAIPAAMLFFPIPIISITTPNSPKEFARSHQEKGVISTYLAKLSEKVLNSEECIDRIICKMPQVPDKYNSKAKYIWEEYGKKLVSNYSPRLRRGLNAYFEGPNLNKYSKCDEQFKCSYKFI